MIYLFSTDAGSSYIIGTLEEKYEYLTIDRTPDADGIVLLTGMVNPLRSHPDRPEFLGPSDRVLAAMDLYRKWKAPYILISGATGLIAQETESEATVLKRWLIDQKIPARRILVETKSRNTGENAIESAKIIKNKKWKRVILVTSAFHMHRSVLAFKKAGIDVIPFPVDYNSSKGFHGIEGVFPAPSSLLHSTYAFKEYLGLIAYRMKGYI